MRLLILAAYPVVRAGLRHLLQNREGLELMTEADCPAEAVSIAATGRPDIVLVDPDSDGVKLEAVAVLTEATVGPDPAVHRDHRPATPFPRDRARSVWGRPQTAAGRVAWPSR